MARNTSVVGKLICKDGLPLGSRVVNMTLDYINIDVSESTCPISS